MAHINTHVKKAVVTSDQGMDVEFSIERCQSFSLDGYFHDEYGFATLPPGKVPTHPAEGTVNGTVIIDVAMNDLGHIEELIELTLEDGFVTDVQGGTRTTELEEIFEGADGNVRNLAEFAIGMNPKAKLIGNTAEDKNTKRQSISQLG